MDSIRKKIQILKDFRRDAPQIAVTLAEEEQETLLKLVFSDQLEDRGVTGDNVPIINTQPYSEEYAEFKASLGLPIDRVNLTLYGDHQAGAAVEANEKEIWVYSEDEKSEKLVFKYGKEIYQLTDENFDYFRSEIILPKLLKDLKDKIL